LLAAVAEVDSGSVKGDYFAGGLSTAGARSVIAVVIAGTAAGACVVSGAVGIPAKTVRKVGKITSNPGQAALAVATTVGGPVMKMVIQMGVVMVVTDVGDLLQTVAATGTGLIVANVLSAGKGRCKSGLSASVLSKSGKKSASRN